MFVLCLIEVCWETQGKGGVSRPGLNNGKQEVSFVWLEVLLKGLICASTENIPINFTSRFLEGGLVDRNLIESQTQSPTPREWLS